MIEHGQPSAYSFTSGPEVSVLLEPYDAVYIEIPKVACTSFKVAFAQLLGISLDEGGGDPHQVNFPAPFAPPSRLGMLYPGLFTFAFVRNPWDRLVSCYRDKIRGEVDGFTNFSMRPGVADCLADFDAFTPDMAFDDFVAAVASIPDEQADAHFRSQSTFLTDQVGEIAVDFVGRYERLLADFNLVQGMIGLPAIELPRLQAARSSVRYVDYYSPTAQKVVAERFAEDIELFQYKFEMV
jgi:hypothetical protein